MCVKTKMSVSSQNTHKIAKNTFMLYIRMLLTMLVALYTSRVVLEVLGVEDFGIYNVVGGIVTIVFFFEWNYGCFHTALFILCYWKKRSAAIKEYI